MDIETNLMIMIPVTTMQTTLVCFTLLLNSDTVDKNCSKSEETVIRCFFLFFINMFRKIAYISHASIFN